MILRRVRTAQLPKIVNSRDILNRNQLLKLPLSGRFPRALSTTSQWPPPISCIQQRNFASSTQRNNESTIPEKEATTPSPFAKPHRPAPRRNPEEPIYELTFTCKKCMTRSGHTISKQGYHKGTVLITCPGCKNRHLISDHLRIFSDASLTIEDIMRQNGELVRKGMIDEQGDVEFWDEQQEGTPERGQDEGVEQTKKSN